MYVREMYSSLHERYSLFECIEEFGNDALINLLSIGCQHLSDFFEEVLIQGANTGLVC